MYSVHVMTNKWLQVVLQFHTVKVKTDQTGFFKDAVVERKRLLVEFRVFFTWYFSAVFDSFESFFSFFYYFFGFVFKVCSRHPGLELLNHSNHLALTGRGRRGGAV